MTSPQDDREQRIRAQIDDLLKHIAPFKAANGPRMFVKQKSAVGIWEDVDVTADIIRRDENLITFLEDLIAQGRS